MFEVLVKVFKIPRYLLLAFLLSFLIFSLAVWLPNLNLIFQIFTDSSVSLVNKFIFLFSLYASIGTNFTTLSAVTVFMIAVLFGVQVSLMLYFFNQVKSRAALGRIGSAGFVGLITGFFGIGCTACGTVLLTSSLSIFGVASVLTFLPLGGAEFGLLGVGLLIYSIRFLLKKIMAPLVCV